MIRRALFFLHVRCGLHVRRGRRARGYCVPLAGALWLLCAASASARELQISVSNQRGEPVADAVIYVVNARTLPAAPVTAVIDQVNKEFVPYVTAVPAGARISFPNNDKIRHHVYSFSPAKTFELPLYKGEPPAPVVFDKPGIVTLGCNIHDWMTSYVFVGDSTLLAQTGKDGQAVLRDLPDGELTLELWHPRLKTDSASTRQTLAAGSNALNFRIEEKAVLRPFRGVAAGKAGY